MGSTSCCYTRKPFFLNTIENQNQNHAINVPERNESFSHIAISSDHTPTIEIVLYKKIITNKFLG